MKKTLLFALLIPFLFVEVFAQSPSKGFNAISDKKYDDAKVVFESILKSKSDDIAANFGMSKVYTGKSNAGADAELALEHFTKAKTAFKSASEKEKKSLDKLDINPAAFSFQEKTIHQRFLNIAKEANTIAAYTEFTERFPESSVFGHAESARDELAYEKANNPRPTVASLTEFINKYPNSLQFEEARNARDEMAFQEAKVDGSAAAFDAFLDKYPGSKYENQVKQTLYSVAFEEAKAAGTSEALRKYSEKYPESHFAAMAKSMSKELAADGK